MNDLAKCSPIYTKGRKVYRPIWPIQTRLWFWSGYIKPLPYNKSSDSVPGPEVGPRVVLNLGPKVHSHHKHDLCQGRRDGARRSTRTRKETTKKKPNHSDLFWKKLARTRGSRSESDKWSVAHHRGDCTYNVTWSQPRSCVL